MQSDVDFPREGYFAADLGGRFDICRPVVFQSGIETKAEFVMYGGQLFGDFVIRHFDRDFSIPVIDQIETAVRFDQSIVVEFETAAGGNPRFGAQIVGVGSVYQCIETGAVTQAVDHHVICSDRRFYEPAFGEIEPAAGENRGLPAVGVVFADDTGAVGHVAGDFLIVPEIGTDNVDEISVGGVESGIQSQTVSVAVAFAGAVIFLPGVRISAVKSQTENVAAVAPNVAVITGFQAENVNTAAGVVFEFEFDAAAQAFDP